MVHAKENLPALVYLSWPETFFHPSSRNLRCEILLNKMSVGGLSSPELWRERYAGYIVP
jgi:hypothetical protein